MFFIPGAENPEEDDGDQVYRGSGQGYGMIVHEGGHQRPAADDRPQGIAQVESDLRQGGPQHLATAFRDFDHQILLRGGDEKHAESQDESQEGAGRPGPLVEKDDQQSRSRQKLPQGGCPSRDPVVGHPPGGQPAQDHAEPRQGHQSRHRGRGVRAHMGQPGGNVTPPAENAGIPEKHRPQDQPGPRGLEETELAFQPRVGNRLQLRNPGQHEDHGRRRPQGQNREGQPPGDLLPQQSAQGYPDHVSHGLSRDHGGDRPCLPARSSQPLGRDGRRPEEGPMRQAGDESAGEKEGEIRG